MDLVERKTETDPKTTTNEIPVENGTGQKSGIGNEIGSPNPTNDNDTYIITNETDPNCTHKIQVFTAAVEDGTVVGTSNIDTSDMAAKDNTAIETVSPVKMEGNGSVSADTPSSQQGNDPTE